MGLMGVVGGKCQRREQLGAPPLLVRGYRQGVMMGLRAPVVTAMILPVVSANRLDGTMQPPSLAPYCDACIDHMRHKPKHGLPLCSWRMHIRDIGKWVIWGPRHGIEGSPATRNS